MRARYAFVSCTEVTTPAFIAACISQRAGLDELERPVVVDDLLRHQGQVGHGERVVAVQVGGGDGGPSRAAVHLAEIALQLVQVVRADLPVAGDVSGRVLRRKARAGPRRSGLRRRRGIPQRAPRRRWQVFPGSPGRGGDASLSLSSRTSDRGDVSATRFPRRFGRISILFRAARGGVSRRAVCAAAGRLGGRCARVGRSVPRVLDSHTSSRSLFRGVAGGDDMIRKATERTLGRRRGANTPSGGDLIEVLAAPVTTGRGGE